MIGLKRLAIVLFFGTIGFFALELGEALSIPVMQSFISPAHAIVGRPLTPVSVAGVARRTSRRCAAGVYHC